MNARERLLLINNACNFLEMKSKLLIKKIEMDNCLKDCLREGLGEFETMIFMEKMEKIISMHMGIYYEWDEEKGSFRFDNDI